MRKIVLGALVFSAMATVLHGQATPVADVAVGYSVIQETSSQNLTANGGNGAVAYNFNDWLGLAGDFGVYHTVSNGTGLVAETYTFGPRFSYRAMGRVVPFGQVLFGGTHASAPSGGYTGVMNAYALGAGGGADIAMGPSGRVALRPQVEYFAFGSIGNTTHTVRASMGIVFRIGRR